jgi:hypothetical protein
MICSFSCCALLTIADFFFRHTSSVWKTIHVLIATKSTQS